MSDHFGQTYLVGTPGTGWRRLDIMDAILDQDPRATPFFEITGEASATNTKHEWQVRGVKARAVNTALEGSTLVGQEVSIPTRVSNTCQIQTTGVEITRTSQAEQHYGVSSIWDDQVQLRTYEHRADTEYALIRGVEAAGNTDEARQMRGLIGSVSTNATDQDVAALTESIFIDGIVLSYNNMDMPQLDAMCNTNIKRVIDQFTSLGGVRNMEVRTRDVVHTVTKYFSSFGEVDIHLSRDMLNVTGASATCELVYFDRTYMKKAYLDRTHIQPVAKTKDGDTLNIIDELTLEWGNEQSSVLFTDLNASI